MPKLKTHKGASKRFKKTGTGKVVRSHAFARHILTSKARKRKKKLHETVVADHGGSARSEAHAALLAACDTSVRTERVARARTATKQITNQERKRAQS